VHVDNEGAIGRHIGIRQLTDVVPTQLAYTIKLSMPVGLLV